MKRGASRNIILLIQWIIFPISALVSALIIWLDRKLQFPLPFPRNVEALAKKENWCINQLKKCNALPKDATIVSYKVAPIDSKFIFRSNAGFIEIEYTIQNENKKLKCFAKFAPDMGTVWNRTIFNMQLNHIKEGFFNQYFVNQDDEIPSPEVYYSSISILTGNLCLITESMDDCMEYHEGAKDDFPDEHLELMLDGLASLHAQYWNNQSKRMNKVMSISTGTVDLFDSMVASSWSVPARKILVQSWCNMNEHQTVIHGDARIGNMMFPSAKEKGRFVFIDWQAVRKGKGAFDLAYLLIPSLVPEYRRKIETKAKDYYYNQLIIKGVNDYSKENFEEDYNHASLCTLVLLALPMLSGEASVDGDAAIIFSLGMNIWRTYLEIKLNEMDHQWIAKQYEITEQEARDAIAEMLKVIEDRLKGISGDRWQEIEYYMEHGKAIGQE